MSILRAVLALFLVPLSLFAAGHDLTSSPPQSDQQLPVVTGNGAGFTAAWTDLTYPRAVMSRGVSGSGEPLAALAISERPASSMAIAHSPFDTLVVINDGNVSAVRLTPSGIPLNTILLWSGDAFQSSREVAVAWNGSRYFVIWSYFNQLIGAFISPGGSSTQPRAFLTEPDSSRLLPPDVAWDGQHFVVVVGEKPSVSCSCPPPDTIQFRVMRVSAGGDAIDASPLVITGDHLRAHVASSGSESLITLDGAGGVSSIIAHDGSALTLDAETPLFSWYANIASAVAWNGLTYTVAWRYLSGYDLSFAAGPGWLVAAQVTRAGLAFDYRATAASAHFSLNPHVRAAANEAGTTALVTEEFAESSRYGRARLYLVSELPPMPAPPPAPANMVSFLSGPYARIDWEASGAENGFVVEFTRDSGKQWTFVSVLPADARSATVTGTPDALYRIRALGPGGSSEGTMIKIVSSQRRRAERP
jgi:hypothetical protein